MTFTAHRIFKQQKIQMLSSRQPSHVNFSSSTACGSLWEILNLGNFVLFCLLFQQLQIKLVP